VVDLESTNGISVNGRRVPSAPLQAGDEIVAGTSHMRFNLD
jgi:pSer/pThr/pTyr-binding forkhead associated (FHA) protein